MKRKTKEKWEKIGEGLLKPGKVKTRLVVLEAMAIVATLVVGYTGVAMMGRTNSNAAMVTDMNNINLLQHDNRSLNTNYLYYLDKQNLTDIRSNLDKMSSYAASARKKAGLTYHKDVVEMDTSISKLKENYDQIIALSDERGFDGTNGIYQQYIKEDESLAKSFQKIKDTLPWVDQNWVDIPMNTLSTVSVGGKNYIKYTFESKLEAIGKRDYVVPRIGNQAVSYAGDIYINNIRYNGSQSLDLSQLTATDISRSYGEAIADYDVAEFAGLNSVKISARFQNKGTTWYEASMYIPVGDMPVQDYNKISYDVYFEVKPNMPKLKASVAFSDRYDFPGALSTVNGLVNSYNKHVVEGADVTEETEKITNLLNQMLTNIDTYVVEESLYGQVKPAFQEKVNAFEQLTEMDKSILALKRSNNEQEETLTKLTSGVRESVMSSMSKSQLTMTIIVVIVVVVTLVILVLIGMMITRGISKSLYGFRVILESMSEGDLRVRANARTNDEFGEFAEYLNQFLDKISKILRSVQKVASVLMISGNELEESSTEINVTSENIGSSLHDVSEGATSQSEDVLKATSQVSTLGDEVRQIVENVEELKQSTELMNAAKEESVVVLNDLTESNDRMTQGVDRIAKQIYRTNMSVEKIKESIELISGIAEQTDLLAKNASAEAGRAGRTGEGFSVVAGEIQSLAKQSNVSTEIIKDVIHMLSEDFANTTVVMEQLEQIARDQLKKLELTKAGFERVNAGIQRTQSATGNISSSTEHCYRSCSDMNGIMTNLSAIAEENTAAAVDTSNAMQNLNVTITELAEAAKQLKQISKELNSDMKFFRL